MKLLVVLTFFLLTSHISWAQYRILGFVYDSEEVPYGNIEVRLRGEGLKRDTVTDETGRFEFVDVPRGVHKVVVITAYGLIEREVNLRTSIEMHLQRPRNIRVDEVVVSAVRAPEDAPLTFTNVSKEEIAMRNLGLDVPYVLGSTPSVVETSDAGTGFGYTGIRIRGTDPTRINVTINGVPLNDAESQSVYWVDLPDLLSSTQSIQIQRGVGSSTFGSGAFGASINLNTSSTATDPHAQVSLSGGSFGTYRANVILGTGLLKNHFTIDGRASIIRSDGFIDRATADLNSGYLTAAYVGANQSLRFNVIHGNERTYQAWNGVPVQYINDPVLRTFNTAGTEKSNDPYKDEVDDYTQTHYQFLWNASVFTQLQFYATAHYTRGKGYYEQYKSSSGFEGAFGDFLAVHGLDAGDAVRRRWLDNDFYGIIGGVHYFDPTDKYSLQLGGAWHRYIGDHFGEVIWSAAGNIEGLPDYYRNDAVKSDKSGFVKLNYHFSDALSMIADVQVRGVNYEYEGLDPEGIPLQQDVKHTFLNPKLGFSMKTGKKTRGYYFFGVAHREPNRDDYITSSEQSRPNPEKLYNSELGWEYDGEILDLGINGYHMYYVDQLVLTGRINDVGEYARQNIDKSSRLGLEATISATPGRFDMQANVTVSRNRVKAFDEYVDNRQTMMQEVASHDDTPLSFSPDFIGYAEVGCILIKSEVQTLRFGMSAKFVGDQYLDNTGNPSSKLGAYSFFDAQLSYGRDFKGGHLAINILLRNIRDEKLSTNAWIYRFRSPDYDPRPDDPYADLEQGDTYSLKGFFPQAGRNVLAGVTISF